MDRLDFLTSRDRRAAEHAATHRTLGQAHAGDRPAWIRVRIHYSRGGARVYTLQAWTDRFTPCDAGTTVQQLLDAHPAIDWWIEHDADAVTGAVYAVPEPHEDGFLPDADRTFGEQRPPRLVADRRWFDTVTPMPARWAA